MIEALFVVALAVGCVWAWRVKSAGWYCECCGKKQDFFATPWLSEKGCTCIDCGVRK